MSIKNSNVTIMVKDMNISIEFYKSIGFLLTNRWGDHYAQLSAEGITIGLHPLGENTFTGSANISIGFTTDNLEDEKQMLEDLSVETELRNEEGGAFIHFKDPDGTQLYFIKPKW